MPFNFKKLEIEEVILITPKIFNDGRGFFVETYKTSDFEEAGITERFVQDNHSKTVKKHTIRGLHFQKEPYEQSKLIRVLKGKILDIVVDIRPDSETFGKWVSIVLDAESKAMIYLPKGFAHGFCTLEDDAEVIYKCSKNYSPNHEGGIIWNDPFLEIEWPTNQPTLSERDKKWGSFKEINGE